MNQDILIDFFAEQTDFSKRLTSWKANRKFEDISKGKTLKKFVGKLKSEYSIDRVFVWHALSGYWGGISDNKTDDFSMEFAKEMDKLYDNSLVNDLVKLEQITGGRFLETSVKEVFSEPTPHLLMIEPALAWDPSSLSGCGTVDVHRLPAMYRLMHSYLSEAGIDGVKVQRNLITLIIKFIAIFLQIGGCSEWNRNFW